MTRLQRDLLPLMESYADVVLPGVFMSEMRSQVRDMYLLHIMSHVRKVRTRFLYGNQLIRKKNESVADSGFRRARVLIVLPARGDAYDCVRRMMDFCGFKEPAQGES